MSGTCFANAIEKRKKITIKWYLWGQKLIFIWCYRATSIFNPYNPRINSIESPTYTYAGHVNLLEWSVFLSENGFMWEIKNIKATYIRQPIGVQLQLHSTILNFVFISIANFRMIALKIRQAAYIFHFIWTIRTQGYRNNPETRKLNMRNRYIEIEN